MKRENGEMEKKKGSFLTPRPSDFQTLRLPSPFTLFPVDPVTPSVGGRHLALFPGAFRPPHQAHFAAILDLTSRPDINEVVVIIANRCRHIPGTTHALDADVAREVLAIYLHDVPKVRIEIARHDAISHALSYIDRAGPGDSLLFCIGEADFEQGDDRFDQLLSQKEHTGVLASVMPAPTGSLQIRATVLREALAVGEAGRTEFMMALPPHLSVEQGERVWTICRNGLRPMSEIVEEKLRSIIDPQLRTQIDTLTCMVPGKLDPVFRAQLREGRSLFIKYAGDTTETGKVGDRLKPKPRRRLGAERRALNYLRARALDKIELAEMISFDKETLTLIQSEVCTSGTSLQDQVQTGEFDPQVAAAVAHFLAVCHTVTGKMPALWGEHETDLHHWQAMLALRTSDIAASWVSAKSHYHLQQLKTTSDAAQRSGFFHLDYCPKNIRISQGKVGVIDLELCSSIGDPAYDLGILLGHYMLWGLRSSSGDACQVAISAAINSYRQQVGPAWEQMSSRVVAFAGASILAALVQDEQRVLRGFAQQLAHTAGVLLSQEVSIVQSLNRY